MAFDPFKPFQKLLNPGKSDKRQANRYMDQLGQYGQQNMRQFQQALPAFQQAIDFFKQNAGLNQGFGQPQTNMAYANRRGMDVQPMDPNMGIWNNPADRFRLQQSRDDIDRYQMQQQNQLRGNLAQRGMMDSSVLGGGMQRLASDAMRQFAQQRQDLAIGAGAEQERRVAQFMQALAPQLAMGQTGANTMQGLAGQKMQQAQQANAWLPQLLGTGTSLYAMGAFGGPPARSSRRV